MQFQIIVIISRLVFQQNYRFSFSSYFVWSYVSCSIQEKWDFHNKSIWGWVFIVNMSTPYCIIYHELIVSYHSLPCRRDSDISLWYFAGGVLFWVVVKAISFFKASLQLVLQTLILKDKRKYEDIKPIGLLHYSYKIEAMQSRPSLD